MPIDAHSPVEATDAVQSGLVEGVARVVALDGHVAWLEPEQTTSCGGCASSGLCGAKGIGTTASRLEMRRFPLTNEPGLALGVGLAGARWGARWLGARGQLAPRFIRRAGTDEFCRTELTKGAL